MRQIGEILIARGQVRKYQLEFLLSLQTAFSQKHPMRIGELLVKHRAVTPAALEQALIIQKEASKESITNILKIYEQEISRVTRMIPLPLS